MEQQQHWFALSTEVFWYEQNVWYEEGCSLLDWTWALIMLASLSFSCFCPELQHSWGWQTAVDVILPNPLTQAGSARASCSEKCASCFFAFFFFSWCQFGISWISFIVPLLLILSPGTIENSSLIFPPSQQVFTHIDKILLSLLFFRLNSPSSLCLSSYIRCSHSIVIFVVLCWTRSSMSVHLLSCVAQHILAALSKGEGCPPPTCWKCSPEFIFAARMHGLHVANFCPQGPVCQGPSEWQHSHPVCQLHFPVFNVYKLARGYTSSHYLGH